MIAVPRPSSLRFTRSVVHVTCGDGAGNAFLIDRRGLFLTALHVLEEREPIFLRRKGQEFKAWVIDKDVSRDLALLGALLPSGIGLKVSPLSFSMNGGRVVIFHMLDEQTGIVKPLRAEASNVGLSAIKYEIDGKNALIDEVWTQSNLMIPDGASGAPVVSESHDSIVAVACAGADDIRYAFFVPLGTVRTKARLQSAKADDAIPKEISDWYQQQGWQSKPTLIQAINDASEGGARLGEIPNKLGIGIRCWLATRAAAQNLTKIGVYDPSRTIERTSLKDALNNFRESSATLAILAGASGVGKSTSIASALRKDRERGPTMLLRAARFASHAPILNTAFASALGLRDYGDLRKLKPWEGRYPLLVIDGINELPISPQAWPQFIMDELPTFCDLLTSKNWKLLLTTRTDRLDIFSQLPETVSLFRPDFLKSNSAEDTNRRKDLPAHIRLESFNKLEFTQLRGRYGLPGDLPFPELRHPIVFKLMVKTSLTLKTTQIRVRNLLAQYVDSAVLKIHARCPDRARDSIKRIIEGWTALPQMQSLGYLPIDAIVDRHDEAIAEAAAAEGLFEKIDGGYRYVYDEIFEFVRAKRLAAELNGTRQRISKVTATVTAMVEEGLTPGAVARALEIFEDKAPDAVRSLAERWSGELASARLSEQEISTAVLSRVEKGSVLDCAKDALPILHQDIGDTWASGGKWTAVSYDHISYAYDLERMWRMVCNAAAADPNEDSYPFRRKDLDNPHASAWVDRDLRSEDRYKVLRHFIEVFPEECLARLLEGVATGWDNIGREHTLGSFCAHAICSYADQFSLETIVTGVIARMTSTGIWMIKRLAKNQGADILQIVLDTDLYLSYGHETISRCLSAVLAGNIYLAPEVERVARIFVLERDGPVMLYISLLNEFASDEERKSLYKRILTEWRAGIGMGWGMRIALSKGLLSFDEVLELFVERHRTDKCDDAFVHLISAVEPYVEKEAGTEQCSHLIDAVVRAVRKIRSSPYQRASVAGDLLIMAAKVDAQPPELLTYIKEIWDSHPETAVKSIKLSLISRNWDAPNVCLQVCDQILDSAADLSILMDILEQGASIAPESGTLRYYTTNLFRKVGEQAVFEWVIAEYVENRLYGTSNALEGLALLLQATAPETFERYRGHFELMIE